MSSSPPLVVADRYRLIAPLGQGGMGRVWRAADVVLHREVAIKELVPPPGLTPGERQEMRERSLREARAIARLNNINVVRVFDVLSTDADPWIVMEYVASRSLQDTLAQDGPFNPLRTAEIGLGVLNALRAAHRNGVVHRDVKPGNVLLGSDGRVVLTDFGLATVPGDPNVTRTGLVLGSPAYIAPERARDGTAGPAADLWSLGATLYAAVEGQSPFARPSAIATLAALATENVPVARNGGPLKPVLNGLLRKDPAHRINAEEAERLLARAAGRRSKVSFPMSPTMRRPGVGRERPSLPSGPGGPPVLPGSGWVTATGSAPVVPNPRPPAVQPATDGRPPHFAQGKAQVAPPEAPRPAKPFDATRLDTPRLDATRLDTPPVRDEVPSTAPQRERSRPPAPVDDQPVVANSAAPTNALRTGFTAADVVANRRKQAAPEHERSLAQATSGYPVVTPRNNPVADDAEPAVVTKPTPEQSAPEQPTPDQSASSVDEPVVEKPESGQPETIEPAAAEPEAAEPAGPEAAGDPPGSDVPEDSPAVAEPVEAASGATPPEAEKTAEPEVEERTSIVALPDQLPKAPPANDKAADKADAAAKDTAAKDKAAEDRTTLLRTPAAEDRTTLLKTPAAEDRTTLLARPADDDKTSVVRMPPRRRVHETPAVPVPSDVSGVPGFNRPDRPAWTPMQLRPASRSTGGVTIFGTTLTRRQAAIGLAIVLTFLLLVGIIVVQAFGGDDGSPDQPAPKAGASAPAKQDEPKKDGAPSAGPASTPAATPPSPSATSGGAVPAGWRTYKGSGYSLPVPESVKGSGGGSGNTLGWGEGRQIRIDVQSGTVDPVKYLREQDNAGTQEIDLRTLDYYGAAAELEYWRFTGSGLKQHVVRRVFNVGEQHFVLTWYTEADDWDAARKDIEAIYAGFAAK